MKRYIVYRQGSNWVAVLIGKEINYETTLPYYVKTKKDVREYLSDEMEKVTIKFQ